MMNGYFISITNNLLEDKHFDRMGNAVWLYMWLIDRMTEISEGQGIVNFGNPITYEMVKLNFSSMGIRTYRRWVDELRDTGYINTSRSKYGLYITVNKAKKNFNKKAKSSSAKNAPSEVPRSAKNGRSDVPKSVVRCAKNVTSPIYKELQYNNNTDLHNSTNVELAETAKTFGKPEINDLFNFWEEQLGYKITSKQTANRRAAHNLIKKYSYETVKKAVRGVSAASEDRYAPGISDFCALQSKWNELVLWIKKNHMAATGGHVTI